MAGGRRNVSKATNLRTSHYSNTPNEDSRSRSLTENQNTANTRLYSPKHMSIPIVSMETPLVFESYMFFLTILSSFLQFLHLYRSIWWLPQSYSRHTMNFYLIDPYLVSFIVLILGRRLLHLLFKELVDRFAPTKLVPTLQQIMSYTLLTLILIGLCICGFFLFNNSTVVNLFFLCYPITIYVGVFGFNISPFFYSDSYDSSKAAFPLGRPIHNCSTSPNVIRKEVEVLKSDFNHRMKHVLFHSGISTYYACFIPCCFAQPFLFYDTMWANQHMVLVWFGTFTMQCTYKYPPSYCDMLHRAALHLGRWWKVQSRSQHIPIHIWDDSALWSHGTLVKHAKDLYKAEGLAVAAEPGNNMHGRFYVLFCNPAGFTIIIFFIHVITLSVQLFVLLRYAEEWHQMISLALLILSNYNILFRLLRNGILCWKVYKAEIAMQERCNN